jgi:hypothetical protein
MSGRLQMRLRRLAVGLSASHITGMEIESKKVSRCGRTRFTLRTLMNVTTLVCVYLACWEITRTRGVEDVVRMQVTPTLFGDSNSVRIWTQPSSPVPFVVGSGVLTRDYYLWFFGYVMELPFHGRGL